MANAITTLEEAVEAVDSGDVVKAGATASAFMRATTPAQLTNKGASFLTLNSKATVVAEGGQKPEAQQAGKMTVIPAKLVAAHIATEEAWLSSGTLREAVGQVMPASFGEDLDLVIMGIDDNPAGSTLTDFSAVTATEVADRAGILTAIGSITSGRPSALVATTGFFYRLAGLENANGVPLFPELVGSDNPTLLGIPVYLVNSAENVAILGDFKGHSRGGAVSGNGNSDIRVHREGTYRGTNLLETNHVLVLVEGWYGFGVDEAADAAMANFKKLSVAEPEA